MADALPPIASLARAREEKVTELSTFFANDDLTLDELERRIERVYKAASVTELETITADLRLASAPAPRDVRDSRDQRRGSGSAVARGTYPPAPPVSAHEMGKARVMAIMSSTRRVGAWVVPRRLDLVGIMTDARLDLTHAVLPPGIVEIDLRLVMAAFKLIVPPNMRVINEAHALMASVTNRAEDVGAGATSADPIIRLTGYAVMADVNVVVRRREDPVYDDDDD